MQTLQPRALTGCELWPIPGAAACAALCTPEGPALASVFGDPRAPGAVIIAGDELELVRGLASHALRHGLGALVLTRGGSRGVTVLKAAWELVRQRGGQRVALIGHGAWTAAAINAARPGISGVAALDPLDAASAEPQHLRGIPLWIASGVDRQAEATQLYQRSTHPRAHLELPGVPRLVQAVNDLASEIIPFVKAALAEG